MRKQQGRESRDQRIDDRQGRGGDGHHRADEEAGRHSQSDKAGIAEDEVLRTQRSPASTAYRSRRCIRTSVAQHCAGRAPTCGDASGPGRRRRRPATTGQAGRRPSRGFPRFAGGLSCKRRQAAMMTWPTSSSQGAKPQLPTRRSIRVWSPLEFMIADVERQHVAWPTRAAAVRRSTSWDLPNIVRRISFPHLLTRAAACPRVRRS